MRAKTKKKMCNSDIILVRPEMVHMLKNSDRPTARQLMKTLGMNKAKRVIIPLNDSEQLEEWTSGNHWTVLIWDRENNTFSHIDSIPGQNTKHISERQKQQKESKRWRSSNISKKWIQSRITNELSN